MGAAIKARCRHRVETAAGRELRPPQAAHCSLVPLTVLPSASCAPIPSATDPQDTHYRIVTRSVENMAEIVEEAEELAEKGLDFPNDLILKLVKAAKDLRSERVKADGTANQDVVELLNKIKTLFAHGVSHDCEDSEEAECAICTGIDEVKAM